MEALIGMAAMYFATGAYVGVLTWLEVRRELNAPGLTLLVAWSLVGWPLLITGAKFSDD
jgi:hypothetical protein